MVSFRTVVPPDVQTTVMTHHRVLGAGCLTRNGLADHESVPGTNE